MTDLGKTLRTEDIEGVLMLSCGLYGKPTNDWTVKHFKHQTYNKGDIMAINSRILLERDTPMVVAIDILEEMYLLLNIPVRWPYELNDENDAKTRKEYYKSLRAFRRNYDGHTPIPRKYRTQTGMTRDPYVYFFAACVKYGMIDYINWTKIPIMSEGHLVYRPLLWAWHKALKTGKRSRLYEFLERKPNHKDDYVNLLRWYRKQAYERRVK